MIDVSDFVVFRDGGTCQFRISGSDMDGLYRLQTPFLGLPEPLFRDEVKVSPTDEARVVDSLESWVAPRMTPDAVAALLELDELLLHGVVGRLPRRILEIIPLHQVWDLVRRLKARNNLRDN